MKKTALGGDRLGSGGKMNINLHGYERSTHDLGYIFRSSMASGTLVPFLKMVALPGDTFEIDLDVDIKTLPTIAPLFGSYKVQLDIFECPIRLYNSWLHNNKLKIGNDMSQVKLPIMSLKAEQYVKTVGEDNQTLNMDELNNQQINTSCILKYLGLSGIGVHFDDATHLRQFNAVPLLAYWDIYKNYYANKQEEIGAVIHTGNIALREMQDMYLNVTSDPNEPGNFWVTKKITVEHGTKNGNSTDSNYFAINEIEIEMVNINEYPDFDNYMIYTYNSATPVTLRQWLDGVNPGFWESNMYYNTNTNTWFIPIYQQAANFGNNGIIWSWNEMTDFTTSINVIPRVYTFPLENLDTMRETIMTNISGAATDISDINLEPYSLVTGNPNARNYVKQTQEGLAIKTYQSDLFNNWVKTEWVEEINNKTAISTNSGKFTIDQLNISKKLYDYYNRVAVSGGSYDDWIEATFDIERATLTEIPVYKGGLIRELAFSEVTSSSATNIESASLQPLGTLAGKGVMTSKKKGGKTYIKTSEPSYIIGIISLTPRIDYSQGNDWDMHLQTLEDLHKPALDGIGFQDLITEQMAWWDTDYDSLNNVWIQKSAGKQPAWMNYMTSINKTYGNFAIENSEMFMTLNRMYEQTEKPNDHYIKDLTTYIDPSKYNNVFAYTKLDAMNFWTQIKVDIQARRKMSAKIIPNL